MAALTVGAGTFAVGVSLVSSATSALTIDRAPVGKLGAAMATYSLGYQLASGVGSLVWGALIAASGFLLGFGAAIALQALTLALTFRFAVNARLELGGPP
jgi:MFS family permease